jgi:hypothetical protein
VLWMYVIGQVIIIRFMPRGFMLLGRCQCYWFLLLVTNVSWVPTIKQFFVL